MTRSFAVTHLLEGAMDAARERDAVIERMESRRELLGLHGRSGEPIASGTVLDPMRQVDEFIDDNASDSMLLEQLESELDEAWQVIGGMSELGCDDGAQVCCRRFLWLESWREISSEIGHDEPACRALMDEALEWADGIGVARLRQESLGKWPAVAPSGNRRWKSR